MASMRLRGVVGYEGRLNDILFHSATVPLSLAPREQQTLVFFGGDVQDYPEVMATHREYRHYQRWNLERTACLLAASFPANHVLVVRPSRIELKSFSCYDNFVQSNNTGVPEHTGTHNALRHLERLLRGVSARLRRASREDLLRAVASRPDRGPVDAQLDTNRSGSEPLTPSPSNGSWSTAPSDQHAHTPAGVTVDPLWWRRVSLEHSRLTLVGFSKGCVVLNQLVHEFHHADTAPVDTHAKRLISQVETMYWLDGGHAGDKDTWLTARCLLETVARIGVQVYIHVSPYQVCDESRPWIGREERLFTGMLTELGAKVSRYMHEGGAPCSLQTHFHVLDNFKHVEDASATATTAIPALPPLPPARTPSGEQRRHVLAKRH